MITSPILSLAIKGIRKSKLCHINSHKKENKGVDDSEARSVNVVNARLAALMLVMLFKSQLVPCNRGAGHM